MSANERKPAAPDQTGADSAEIIRPVGYQPREAVEERRFPLSPVQLTAIAVAIPVLVVVWFIFTAKSVRLDIIPTPDSVSISGGLSFELGGVYLLRAGAYELKATAAGHYSLDAALSVGSARNQAYEFRLVKLPGLVSIRSQPEGSEVVVGGRPVGITPLVDEQLPAGRNELILRKDRYQDLELVVDVIGMNEPQEVDAELRPAWADVALSSTPSGAAIFIDDEATGVVTPGTVEMLAGEHELRVSLEGHKSFRQRLVVAAEEKVTLDPITLEQADGLLSVTTVPTGAGVTVNGVFEGETPLELAVQSGQRFRVQVFKAGYESVDRSVNVSSGASASLELSLARLTGEVVVLADPPDAELLIDGRSRGAADQVVTLPTQPHRIEIRKEGYAGYSTELTPRNGLRQEVRVRLLTVEEARLAALKPTIRTALGQELVLLKPEDFQMGASRRQPGRRANETMRDVTMSRLFYLGTQEVTNAQYKAFDPRHDSGSFQEHELNKDDQPVVRVSWERAAAYGNWLSQREGHTPFYEIDNGKVVGSNPRATGYRLPTEAEWAWAVRQVDAEAPLRFPWGAALPPPDRHGNYADRSAAHLVGRIIFGYNDNHIVSAPAGTFAPNRRGLYDLSGNVSEWISDFYEIPPADAVTDPLGPDSGEFRVIRGSSWMHGTITELRISFRDYGLDGRQDVGFRLARFAEAN